MYIWKGPIRYRNDNRRKRPKQESDKKNSNNKTKYRKVRQRSMLNRSVASMCGRVGGGGVWGEGSGVCITGSVSK